MKPLSLDLEFRLETIGWYQIVGGALGLAFVTYSFIHVQNFSGLNFLFFILAYFLFGFSIYCGNLLKKKNPKGLNLSKWNQALQVLQFGILSIGFAYYSGLRAGIGFNWGDNFSPDASLSLSGFDLSYNTRESSQLTLWINFVPIIILYLIDRIESEIAERKKTLEEVKLNLSQQEMQSPEKSTNT